MYDAEYELPDYADNREYRETLRHLFRMEASSGGGGGAGEDAAEEYDEETRDELNFDQQACSLAMDALYERLRVHALFRDLFAQAAALMFSEDQQIGLAVLFSYDYLRVFHPVLRVFLRDPSLADDHEAVQTLRAALHR